MHIILFIFKYADRKDKLSEKLILVKEFQYLSQKYLVLNQNRYKYKNI